MRKNFTAKLTSLIIGSGICLTIWSSGLKLAKADNNRTIGLGVAGGFLHSATKISKQSTKEIGSRPSLLTFVDIPLTETFYLTHAANVYKLNLGKGEQPATDLALNFKFIAPLALLKIGGGLMAGCTVTDDYYLHVGALGLLSINLIANLDVLAMLQYKKILRDENNINDIQGFIGGIFHL